MTVIRRRTVRDTNFRHRHDALTPLDLLEIERLRSSITEQLTVAIDTMMFSATLASLTISEIQNGNDIAAARIISTATSGLYDTIAANIYSDMLKLLSLEYSMTEGRIISFCRRPRRRMIHQLDDHWAYAHTRHTKKQLAIIKQYWRVPEFVTYESDNRHAYVEPGETCLIVSLTFISTESPIYHLFDTCFGGDPRPWGRLIAEFVKIIVTNFYNKISGRSLEMYVNRLGDYAAAIAN